MTLRLSCLLLTLLFLVACSEPAPRGINYDKEQCASCKMGITDQKFGAEIVTKKGKIFVFDAPECMINYIQAGTVSSDDVHSLWVTNFLEPGTLIKAETACYLHSDMIHSPMTLDVAAFKDSATCEKVRLNFAGDVLNFDAVRKLVLQ
ncbi:MAG: hypothetical protein D8M52_04330 [Chlorobi bacterium]|nr:MAG: hypothetical protein F9K28_03465 [Bacteroidota bacterium]KXK34628.1 MAG: nitrous-oxide reductase accessory protein NosL [Chlorobi bacterium OLB6]MBE2265908.1 nitrous oxide reductase accessory protein NosL [Flavobacteriales bacterium]MBL1160931.1 hypothetical protein [Chlorobiota bacterium]MBW7852892.1 nitrous oxide reductase accessory protein NosL [Candidatus Kapabacteria bacterium]MCC6330877.1 nitrous oxide reductase accessory protein NosL [Ignavibacteria bacterium]